MEVGACAVLCSADGILSEFDCPPDRGRGRGIVLLLGLVNMMRGGSPSRSQNLMRLRVLLQFIAIVITMVVVWAMGK